MTGVLVTRPAHQADALCRLLEARGLRPVRLPLIVIEAVVDPDGARRILNDAREFDWWLFTSPNAVHQAAALLDAARWPERLAAVGAGTAAALQALGRDVAVQPAQRYSAEALLALPEFGELDGQRALIVTGEGGRETLDDTLRQRGAEVVRCAVYRRTPLAHSAQDVAAALAQCEAAVITSAEAFAHLLQLTPEQARNTLLALQLVTPSSRVIEMAAEAGFHKPVLHVEAMSDEAAVTALQPEAPSPTTSMNEPESTPTQDPPPAPPPRPARSTAWLAWLLLLVVVAAGGYGSWLAWEFRLQTQEALSAHDTELARAQRRVDELERRAERLTSREDDLAQAARRNTEEIAALNDRFEETDQLLARLADTVQGGQVDLQLAAVEQLLLLASERLQLAGDKTAATRALALADQRLAALNDPRVFRVREAIADERAALAEVPAVDRVSAALTLSSLIARSARLPLRVRAPDRFQAAPGTEPMPPAADARWWERVGAAVRVALSSVFVLRRDDKPMAPLLTPEQERIVRDLLQLKLEGARVALIRGDGVIYREQLGAASAWLGEQFQPQAAEVQGAVAEIQRLQSLDVAPPVPDISRSVKLLRSVIEAP